MNSEVFYQTFWMRAYNHPTPKRSVVYSASPLVKKLDRGSMKRDDLKGDISTTDRYVDGAGHARFKGNKALKGPQFLDSNRNSLLVS